MADTKRLQYHDGQLLDESDFTDEQDYHREMRKRHNRSVHSWGIVEGLKVTTAGKTITITPGMAIDKDGQELILKETQDLAEDLKSATRYVTAKFEPVNAKGQPDSDSGVTHWTRTIERPNIEVTRTEAKPTTDGSVIVLTMITWDGEGKITVDDKQRSRSVSSRIDPAADLTVRHLLVNGNVGVGTNDPGNYKLKVQNGDTYLDGKLTVSGATSLSGAVTISKAVTLNKSLTVSAAGSLSFGAQVRQMINLYGTDYGIGVQASTQYYRTGKNFVWYKGGSHNNDELNAGGGTVQMVIKDGNVGIGTTDPGTARLKVDGTLNVTGVSTLTGGVTIPDPSSLSFGGTTRQMINLWGTTHGIGIQGSTQYFRTDKNFAWYKGGTHNGVELDAGGGTVQMVIKDGNVGIGTASPGSKLEVGGTLTASTNDEPLVALKIAPTFQDSGKTGVKRYGLIVADGNVGIGTNAPEAKLEVAIAAADDDTKPLVVGKGTTNYLTMLNNGNVGIGATAPVATLQIGETIIHRDKYDFSISKLLVRGKDHNGGKTPAVTQSVLALVREGVADQAYGNMVDFRLGRWEHPGATSSRSQLDIYLTEDRFVPKHVMSLRANGNVGIGATGPEAKLDVNGDVIVAGAIKGRRTEEELKAYLKVPRDPKVGDDFNYKRIIANLNAVIIQDCGYTAAQGPHAFALNRGYLGEVQIVDLTTGNFKTFIIDHPLHQDKYLMHATLEGPEGAVYYRGSARLENGGALIQLPDYFEALARPEGRTILLTNVDGFDPLAVLTQDGAQIKEGRFIVVSANKESNQAFYWEVKAIRKDVQTLEVEPPKSAIKIERFGPYAYAVPADGGRMRTEPLHTYPSTAGPQTGAGHISGACGPRSKITNIR